MILSGILGLLQIVLLPGLLSLRLFRLQTGKLERLILVFPLSLIANYLLVWLLTLLHCYSRPVLWGVILAETLALIRCGRARLKTSVSEDFRKVNSTVTAEIRSISEFLQSEGIRGWIWCAAGCAVISAILWGLHLLRLNLGTVFTGWDTVFSWNRYAVTWASGRVPVVHGLYPQLVPANWSVSYVLLGTTEIQLFNTLLPPLFFLWILLMFFDLGYSQKEFGWFFAAILCRYMMKKLMGDGLFDGYMDVPAACMTLLSVYTLIRGKERSERILLSFVFACAALVTKQSGCAALVFFPLTVLCLIPGGFKNVRKSELLWMLAAFALIVCPWYVRSLILSRTLGSGQAEAIADGVYLFNETYEWSHKVFLARQYLGRYEPLFWIALIGLILVPGSLRLPLFLYAWPQTLIWVLFFTYDIRNVAPALPFIAASCGLAFSAVTDHILRGLKKLRAERIPLMILLILCVIVLAVAGLFLVKTDALYETQRVQQRELFGARLNRELLFDRFGFEHEGNDILTDYPADYLPGYAECCRITDLSDGGAFSASVQDPGIRWLLLPQDLPESMADTKAALAELKSSGSVTEIRCSDGYFIPYCLYQITK